MRPPKRIVMSLTASIALNYTGELAEGEMSGKCLRARFLRRADAQDAGGAFDQDHGLEKAGVVTHHWEGTIFPGGCRQKHPQKFCAGRRYVNDHVRYHDARWLGGDAKADLDATQIISSERKSLGGRSGCGRGPATTGIRKVRPAGLRRRRTSGLRGCPRRRQ